MSSSALYLLEFDKILSNFRWSKIETVHGFPARAYHSAEFLPKLGAVAIVGGITCDKDGQCVRNNINVILIHISNWSWTVYDLSNQQEVFLSSSKVLLVQPTTLAYFGGYTNKETSVRQEENRKTNYWGTITFHQRTCDSLLHVNLRGKPNKLGAFACGDAIMVGGEVLVACGTQRQWGICTDLAPQAQPCDLPGCTSPANADKWIRYKISYMAIVNMMFVSVCLLIVKL